jgi:hypothetical protein
VILDRFLRHAEIITIINRRYRLKDRAGNDDDKNDKSLEDKDKNDSSPKK